MDNKRELIENAKKLGIDTTDLTKSELMFAITEKNTTETVTEAQDNDNVESDTDFVDMPEASKSKTTSDIATKTDSKLKATTRPSDIVKLRQEKKKISGYPKHLPHNIMQPSPHGLSTGG